MNDIKEIRKRVVEDKEVRELLNSNIITIDGDLPFEEYGERYYSVDHVTKLLELVCRKTIDETVVEINKKLGS